MKLVIFLLWNLEVYRIWGNFINKIEDYLVYFYKKWKCNFIFIIIKVLLKIYFFNGFVYFSVWL